MKKPVTKADLQHKVKEFEAQLIHQYHFATRTIDRASIKKTMGSAAIKADLKRSYELTAELKP